MDGLKALEKTWESAGGILGSMPIRQAENMVGCGFGSTSKNGSALRRLLLR
jgi:hypothetical protein